MSRESKQEQPEVEILDEDSEVVDAEFSELASDSAEILDAEFELPTPVSPVA